MTPDELLSLPPGTVLRRLECECVPLLREMIAAQRRTLEPIKCPSCGHAITPESIVNDPHRLDWRVALFLFAVSSIAVAMVATLLFGDLDALLQ